MRCHSLLRPLIFYVCNENYVKKMNYNLVSKFLYYFGWVFRKEQLGLNNAVFGYWT